jgi:hypothetical protein
MKRLSSVILASVTLLVLLFSRTTQDNSFELPGVVQADEKSVTVAQALSGLTTRVSVASNGTQGDNPSFDPAISADGRYVVFVSTATNFVSGDTNNAWDVFVYERQTGQTSRVSIAFDGSQASGNSTILDRSSLSTNGQYAAFVSFASNLVNSDINGKNDVFVHAFPVYVYLPLVLKPPPTGALTFENYTGNPIFVNLIGYDTRTFPTSVGPHLWAGIPVDTYDWEATGTCNGQSGTVGSTQTGGNFRAPITIIANQTVLLNVERGGKFTCG